MDCEYDTSTQFITYEVQDQPIKSLKMRVNPCNSGTYLNSLHFKYEDGKEDELFSYNTSGNFVEKEIPIGHQICGIYAYTAKPNEYIRMHAVGFVLEKI